MPAAGPTPGGDGLLEALQGVVGHAHVLTDDHATAGYRLDWTGRFGGPTRAVVRPADTDQVAATLRICSDAGVPVVPQGGNTGLVGGGVPRDGELVLSLRRLDTVGPVDPHTPSITVGAGVTAAAVQQAVAGHGLALGVDLAARDSATIGGMVATNAGGIHVVAHGSMRQQVLGVEAVLSDGTVVRHMAGLVKDNAGPDLGQLLTGSEGILAVITSVILRLVPRPTRTTVAVIGCATVDDALELLAGVRRARPLAVEVMRGAGVAMVAQHTGTSVPIDPVPPWLVLVEVERAGDDGGGDVGSAHLVDAVGDRPTALAQDAADARRLWQLRERHTEAINARGVPIKLDVTVPLDRLTAFLDRLDAIVPAAVCFGHLAEGNLHVNLLGEEATAANEVAVLRLVAEHRGSIASEHGVGVAKVAHLHLTRTAEEVEALRRIRRALDPAGILNPGVVLPVSRSGR